MSPEALIGMELGNSVIQRLLGQGTMGTIYLATRADRQVAIKVLLPSASLTEADNEIFLQRLEEIIARSASLDHPHILPILHHGRQGQMVYQITPYVAGESLEALFARSQTLSFVQIQHYLEQMAAALDYAHTHGILHGDIKASNVLLTPAGDLFVSDFGLAKLTIEKNFASVRRALPGMLNAIAPEYVLSQATDQRADIYALGVVLYQMVTGMPPFQGNSLGEVAMKHVQSTPPSPQTLRTDLPLAAEQAMIRALAKNPTERYTHARDLATAFGLALAATHSAPAPNKATHALNALTELASRPEALVEPVAVPRTGGLFDPKWRSQTSLPTPARSAQPPQDAEATQSAGTRAPATHTLTQLSPAYPTPADQPTNPVPVVQPDFAEKTEQAGPGAQSPQGVNEQAGPGPGTRNLRTANEQINFGTANFPMASEQIPTLDFPATPEATVNSKRAGLPGASNFQASTHEQSLALSGGNAGMLQLVDAPVNNTDELKNLNSQQLPSPTGMLGALAQFPGNGDGTGTGTIKLTESVKIVQVPIAGQPGRFMTGYLSTLPAEQPEVKLTRGLSTRMRIVSIILAVIIVATGSGAFLATRGHSNQVDPAARGQATPNLQATTVSQASATASANIILSDTLNQNTNQWPTGLQNWYTCAFQNGAYHISNHDKQKSASVLLPRKTINGPLTYSLTMQQVKGDQTSSSNLFGMILYATVQNVPHKPQVDKFYAFEILNDSGGQYQFWKYDNSKSTGNPWNQLWTKNFGKEFKQGSGTSHVNTVKIVATDKMFTFIVNNKQVGTWKDHSFSAGGVGMLVNLDGSEVAFSNLLLTYA
ncbi:MAG TPA: protein kinase [Ktedonobacteraceae bacterium]